MSSGPENGVRWRLDDHARRIADVERRTEDNAVIRSKLDALAEDFRDLRDEVREDTKGLRRTIIGAAIGVCGAFVGLAAALVITTAGGIG